MIIQIIFPDSSKGLKKSPGIQGREKVEKSSIELEQKDAPILLSKVGSEKIQLLSSTWQLLTRG